MFGKLSCAIALLISIGAGSVRADDALLEQLYGNGVHAYNHGDYLGANDSLTAAIKGGTNDPRAYYFRGLAFLQLGRLPEAASDFKAGAELEVGDSLDVYPVNRSLERVQGRSRQILEQYRTVVHATAIQRKEAERRVRYEQRAAAEQDVLRRVGPTELPSTGASQPSGAAAGPDTPADENPFSKPAADAVPESKTDDTKPPEKAAPAEDKNPFEPAPAKSEPAKPAPSSVPPASDDPFGEPAPKAAPPANDHSAAPPAMTHPTSAAVKPTSGGLGSLFHAVASGLQSDKPAAAPNSTQVPDILRGILGNNQTPPAGAPANSPAAAADMSQPPQAGMPPAATPPAAMPPQPPQQEPSPPVAGGEMPAAQPPAATEQPQPSTPATQPANPAPQPSNPAEPPKNDDNPFN